MRFPKERLRFSRTHEGSPSVQGYLVLNLKGLDLEGVTQIVVEWSEIETTRLKGDSEETEKIRVRDLLGGG